MCSGPFSGSLPRPAPPVPLSKPRDGGLGVLGGLGLHPQHLGLSQASLTSGNGSPRPPRMAPQDREREAGAMGSLRRGSFVERCQELAKGTEVGPGGEGSRRSLAGFPDLEARRGLRTPSSFSSGPASSASPRSPSPSSPSSSTPGSSGPSQRSRPSASSPSPAPAGLSPIRSQTPVSPRRIESPPIEEALPPSEVSASPESPPSAPPTSPKPPMNETSF